MLGHITYLSDDQILRIRRKRRPGSDSYGFGV
jgi:hypothetical protein